MSLTKFTNAERIKIENTFDKFTVIRETREDKGIKRLQILTPNGFNINLKGAALKQNRWIWGDIYKNN